MIGKEIIFRDMRESICSNITQAQTHAHIDTHTHTHTHTYLYVEQGFLLNTGNQISLNTLLYFIHVDYLYSKSN